MDSGRRILAFLANACQALPSGPFSLAMICPTYMGSSLFNAIMMTWLNPPSERDGRKFIIKP